MSEEAFKDSLAIELKMLLAENPEKEVIFVFGNHGKKFIKEKFDTDEGKILVISNFVGFMLDRACEYGVRKIFFAGSIGRDVIAAGVPGGAGSEDALANAFFPGGNNTVGGE